MGHIKPTLNPPELHFLLDRVIVGVSSEAEGWSDCTDGKRVGDRCLNRLTLPTRFVQLSDSQYIVLAPQVPFLFILVLQMSTEWTDTNDSRVCLNIKHGIDMGWSGHQKENTIHGILLWWETLSVSCHQWAWILKAISNFGRQKRITKS